MTLYHAFMYPYLLYGNIVWGNAAASTLWPALHLQKMAQRMIFKIKRRQSTSMSFKLGSILKLPDIIMYSVTIFMHKFHKFDAKFLHRQIFSLQAIVGFVVFCCAIYCSLVETFAACSRGIRTRVLQILMPQIVIDTNFRRRAV